METIGVRELRQHASRYLERVDHGESFEVTNHGRLVARLEPAHARPDSMLDLVAKGLALPPRGDLVAFLEDQPPSPAPPGAPRLSEALDEQRSDRS